VGYLWLLFFSLALSEGFAAVSGEVEFADGSHAWAVPASAQIMTNQASSTNPGFARLVSS
jgi:hypothetical protein